MATEQTQALTVFEGDSVDQFFGKTPISTDWEWLYAHLGEVDVHNALDNIVAMEPLTPGSTKEHSIWVEQQIIRLVLCYNERKPVLGGICPECGQRRADLVLGRCLPCAEFGRQMPYIGNRGSCSYLRPTYDVQTHTWGIVYYWDSNGNTLLMWVAKGFISRQEACLALYPIALYTSWLERKYMGVRSFLDVRDALIDLVWLVKNKDKIPFDPHGWTMYLRGQISEHMQKEHNLLRWTTNRAIRDYERQENE